MLAAEQLIRGQVYHFYFVTAELDAVLSDTTIISNEIKSIKIYPLNKSYDKLEESEIDISQYNGAVLLNLRNSPAIGEQLSQVYKIFESTVSSPSWNDMLEDDAVSYIEEKEDITFAGFYLRMFLEGDISHGVFSICNSMPFVLKRNPDNRLAYQLLLYAIGKYVSLCKDGLIPYFVNQDDIYSHENINVMRRVGYMLRNRLYDDVKLVCLNDARRFKGYLFEYQSYGQNGRILFANEKTRINFSMNSIADKRLIDLLKIGFIEVGRIEVEFSLGISEMKAPNPRKTMVCTRIVMTPNAVQLYNAMGHSLNNELQPNPDYRDNQLICPTHMYDADFNVYLLMRGNKVQNLTAPINAYQPIGTKLGTVVKWSSRKGYNGDIWEGEIACEGNLIRFNGIQVIDPTLRDKLLTKDASPIGTEVLFEPAFNTTKNRVAVWADAVRLPEYSGSIPPEYDPNSTWTERKSMEGWVPSGPVPSEYKSLQPWLPLFNPLLERCYIGELDVGYLIASNSFQGGRITARNGSTQWHNFLMTAIADQFLLSVILSSACYNYGNGSEAGAVGPGVEVFYTLRPGTIPGREIADNIILTNRGRVSLRTIFSVDVSYTKNRFSGPLLSIPDGFIPANVKNRPMASQATALRSTLCPDIFEAHEYCDNITSAFPQGGIIVSATNGAEVKFNMDQIYEEGLADRVQEMARNRYANLSVCYKKRQFIQEKSWDMAIRADEIRSETTEKPKRSAQYLSLIDEVNKSESEIKPDAPHQEVDGTAKQEMTQQQIPARLKAVGRTGLLLEVQSQGDGFVCTIFDDNPTVWKDAENRDKIHAIITAKWESVTDERLKQVIRDQVIQGSLPVQVLFDLCKSKDRSNAPFQAGNVRLSQEAAERFGFSAPEDALPEMPLSLVDEQNVREIRWAKGIISNNEGFNNIVITVLPEGSTIPVANGRHMNYFRSSCYHRAGSMYVLEKSLQEKLNAGEADLEVYFTPIASYYAGDMYPWAAYLRFTEEERARNQIDQIEYYANYPSQEYKGVFITRTPIFEMPERPVAAMRNPDVHDNSAQGNHGDSFADLLYSHAPNQFDMLLRGESGPAAEAYRDAASLFRDKRYPAGHTQLMQKRPGEGGINGAHRDVRIAYADALIRNWRTLYPDDETYGLRFLNILADLYCANCMAWQENYDAKAHSIMMSLYDRIHTMNSNAQRATDVLSKIALMVSAKNNLQGTSNVSSTSQARGMSSAGFVRTDNVNGTPTANQQEIHVPEILAKVPYLKVNMQKCKMADSISYHNYSAYHNTRPRVALEESEFSFLGYAGKLGIRTTDERVFVEDLQKTLFKKAEDFLRRPAPHVEPDKWLSKDQAVFTLYSIFTRYYQDSTFIEPEYRDFARRAISLAFLGNERYKAIMDNLVAGVALWQNLNIIQLPNDMVLLPETVASPKRAKNYLTLLLQAASLEDHPLFLRDEEISMIMNRAEGNPWHEAMETIWHFLTDPDNTNQTPLPDDFQDILQVCGSCRKALRESLPIFSLDKNEEDIVRELQDAGTRIEQIKAALRRITGENRIFNDYCRCLGDITDAISSSVISRQIDVFSTLLRQGREHTKPSLYDIERKILDTPTMLEAEYLLPSIDSCICAVNKILTSLCLKIPRERFSCTLEQGTISDDDSRLLVPLRLNCDKSSARCSNIRLIAKGYSSTLLNEVTRSVEHMNSGSEEEVRLVFDIGGIADIIRERQTIQLHVTIVYSTIDASKPCSGQMLNCEEKYLVPCKVSHALFTIENPFDSTETVYTPDEKHVFVGREEMLEKARSGLADETSKSFKGHVGITIVGRKRTGKSWFADKMAYELRALSSKWESEDGRGAKLILCNRLDLLELQANSILMNQLIIHIKDTIINHYPEDADIAKKAYNAIQPAAMFETLEKVLENHINKSEDSSQFGDLLRRLNGIKSEYLSLGAIGTAPFSIFYSTLNQLYQERHGKPLPPIVLILDEFTSVDSKIMNGSMSRDDILSVLKLIETYPISIVLICADYFPSVKDHIDPNAFTHYKLDINMKDLDEPDVEALACRKLYARPRSSDSTNVGTWEMRIDQQAARNLHRLFGGNVYLTAKALHSIIDYMNLNGFQKCTASTLGAYKRDLVSITMDRVSMDAYLQDGRFEPKSPEADILYWLNVVALSTIARAGGTELREKVLEALKNEYIALFDTTDNSRLVNVLHARSNVNLDKSVISGIIASVTGNIAPDNVLTWLEERGVIRVGSNKQGDKLLLLPLDAYIEARKNPLSEVRTLEELPDYSDDTKTLKVGDPQETMFDNAEDDSYEDADDADYDDSVLSVGKSVKPNEDADDAAPDCTTPNGSEQDHAEEDADDAGPDGSTPNNRESDQSDEDTEWG